MRGLLAALLVSSVAANASAALPDFFEVETGYLSGMVLGDGATRAYLGIPYAAPPVDELRWRPPQSPSSWDALYEAIEYGPACPQPPRTDGGLYTNLTEELDEDCLYLNVWTGAASQEDKRPVMVWIHGGGFIRSSGARPVYDGAALARKGVVVVTFNYRLGVFGFLAHPALSTESAYGGSGNYALMDQIAALQWVQRNIAQFGGDPGNVTVFGESAGSMAISALMASARARGLFHRAIGQSGALLREGLLSMATMDEASSRGEALMRTLGTGDLEEMRALDSDALIEGAGSATVYPHIDGFVLTEPVQDTFAAGRNAQIPVLVGSNADEATALVGHLVPESRDDFVAAIEEEYGERADRFLELYPFDGSNVREAFLRSRRDSMMTCPMRRWAKAVPTAYVYYFTRVPPNEQSERYGAYHTAEIPYAFDNLDESIYSVPMDYEGIDRELASAISSYWIHFATSGDPNGPGLPRWPAFDSGESYLELGDEIRLGTALRRDACNFFDVTR